jgi:VCBS repeat protein
MRQYSTLATKVFVSALLVVCTATASLAQVTLRKALDVDADGKADFSIFRASDQNWYIFRSGGGVTVQNWGIPNEDFPTPGDYDGDGKGDISVYRDTTGTWYRLNSSTSTVAIVQWGTTGDEPVARDYDGDGKTDIAIVRRSNNVMTWYVFRSSDSGVNVVQWGASGDFTAPGDYDGDGKFDYCVQRPGATLTAPASFYALESTAGVNIVQWGQGNDTVVPGDYDGDGKTDFAVVREGSTSTSPLTWYIYNSATGTASVVQWGLTGGDLITQNDYDGDGKTDIAVWRDATGTFWYIRSFNGQVNAVGWGVPNDFPIAGYDSH